MVGKCSDGELDFDGDVVAPAFMKQAVDEWLRSYPAVRMQHRQDYPAGRGLEAWQDSDGATWLRSLIVDDKAVKLVKSGVLRAYSVGIAEPKTRPHAKATRFEIYGGRLVEVSIVDSPANARAGIEVCKSVGGVPQYTGKAFKVGKPGKPKKYKVNKAHQALYDDPAAYREWLAKQAAVPGPALDSVAAMFLNSTNPQLRELLSEALAGGYGRQG